MFQISSLKETLQQTKQDYKTETERAESLENQSTKMVQKIEDLEQELAKKEKVLNKKEVTDTTSQTEDSFCEVRALEFTKVLTLIKVRFVCILKIINILRQIHRQAININLHFVNSEQNKFLRTSQR